MSVFIKMCQLTSSSKLKDKIAVAVAVNIVPFIAVTSVVHFHTVLSLPVVAGLSSVPVSKGHRRCGATLVRPHKVLRAGNLSSLSP